MQCNKRKEAGFGKESNRPDLSLLSKLLYYSKDKKRVNYLKLKTTLSL